MTTPTQTLIDALRNVIDCLKAREESVPSTERRPVKDHAEADAALADGKLWFGGVPITSIRDRTFGEFSFAYTVPVDYVAPGPEPEWRILDPSELVAAAEARDRGEIRMERSPTDGAWFDCLRPPEWYASVILDQPRRVSPATWQPPAPPTTERVGDR